MAPSDKNEIYLSSSPHAKKVLSTAKVMACVIISLLPICVYGIYLFGLPALVTLLVSVASCVLFEFLFQLATKQKITVNDGSAALTGFLMALVMPPTVPVWMTVMGAFFAIVIAKGFFGGVGSNVFNPALAGRAFMFVSFPTAMGAQWLSPCLEQRWTHVSAKGFQGIVDANGLDAISSATTLSQIKLGAFAPQDGTFFQYFLGQRAGCIGETAIFLIVLAFVFLFAIRIIDGKATISMVAVNLICVAIASAAGKGNVGQDVLMALLTGGLLFGAVFMATDYATTPVTGWGRVIFGAGCGLITFLIRKFGGYPEGVMFSILIMNCLTSFLNKIVGGRKYGYAKKSNKGAAK